MASPFDLDHYRSLLDELEPHVQSLRVASEADPPDNWQAQVDLIHFQIKLQEAADSERAQQNKFGADIARLVGSNGEESGKAQLKQLNKQKRTHEARINATRQGLAVARCLGDAWAWAILDETVIVSLARKERIGRIPSGEALRGVLWVAELMANAGAGFPIVHDMTNCLRVGDVSFARSDGPPLTVEVKTQPEEEGNEEAPIHVDMHFVKGDEAYWHEIARELESQAVSDGRYRVTAADTSGTPHERLGRQVEHMRDAIRWQQAQPGQPMRLSTGETLLTPGATIDDPGHWDVMQRLVEQAMINGVAYEIVDDAMLYAAVYSKEPVWEAGPSDWVLSATRWALRQLVVALPTNLSEHIHPYRMLGTHGYANRDTPMFVFPYFVYPLMTSSIIDIMQGRLTLFVGLDTGKVADALRAAGFDVSVASKPASAAQPLRIYRVTRLVTSR